MVILGKWSVEIEFLVLVCVYLSEIYFSLFLLLAWNDVYSICLSYYLEEQDKEFTIRVSSLEYSTGGYLYDYYSIYLIFLV